MPAKIKFNSSQDAFLENLFNIYDGNKAAINIPNDYHAEYGIFISYKVLKARYDSILKERKGFEILKRKSSSLENNISSKKLCSNDTYLTNINTSECSQNNVILNSLLQCKNISDFINKVYNVNESKSAIPFTYKLKGFLKELNLKEIKVNSDGLCFINCIRLFKFTNSNININIETFREKFREYFIINKIHELINENDYNDTLESHLNKYFSERIYNNNFTDYIINVASSLFKITIVIINVNGSNINLINKLTTAETDSTIYIVRKQFSDAEDNDCFHFNLLEENTKHDMSLLENIDSEMDDESLYNSEDEIEKHDTSEPAVTILNAKKCCKWCGKFDHLRKSSKLCPYYGKLVNKQTHDVQLDTFKIAWQSSFNENIVQGSDVDSLTKTHYCGAMDKVCTHCKALLFKQENEGNETEPQGSICCANGKVILPVIKEPPKYLSELLEDKHFMDNIRAYNSALSFTSLGADIDKELANNKSGVYTFRLHGLTYHRIGSALPTGDEEKPKFAQLYVYDTKNELENRFINFRDLNIDILKNLQDLLHKYNPYVDRFKQFGLELKENSNLKMIIKGDSNIDRRYANKSSAINLTVFTQYDKRTYNKPTSSEVAAILPGDENSEYTYRDIIISGKDDIVKRINQNNASYDALHYVLPFSRGEQGYELNIKQRESEKCITAMQYYSYRLQIRDFNNISINNFGRLFQQYTVDMYSKIELQRLNYIRFSQKELRADLYKNLIALKDDNLNNVGKKVILPATFTGSERYMYQSFQNAMALVRKFKKPNLFITFTCNPNWVEIQRNMRKNEEACNRPDLCSRVFRIKLKELMKDIVQKQIFGKVLSYTYVIEFQKRGLPHCHILLILDKKSQPNTVDDYDHIVSAEIPDASKNPLLYEIITKFNIHGPCSGKTCIVNGKCSKQFPKDFNNQTYEDENGYPHYRRRKNDVIKKGTRTIDNRFVVPYNPYLSKKYNAHINVEICSSVRAVKYLYKYVYKGHDRAVVQLSNDEIERFVEARYISSSESCWRIFHFAMQKQYPNVYKLAVHLEDEQNIYFNDDDDINHIIDMSRETTLTKWFEMNNRYPECRRLKYIDFCDEYVWYKDSKTWSKRKKEGAIARMVFVSPSEGERYFLRLLLTHVPGAKGFTDLRTVNNVTHATFKNAAIAYGLLEDDTELHACLKEASEMQTGKQLRNLFALILCNQNEINDAYELWDKFKDNLCEDILYDERKKTGNDEIKLDNNLMKTALIEIEYSLNSVGKSLNDFEQFKSFNIREALNGSSNENVYDKSSLKSKAKENQNLFTSEQTTAFNEILKDINSKVLKSKIFFIDGCGGSGKTFLYNTLLAKIRSEDNIAIGMASSGVASLLLDNGRTAHFRLKIPLKCNNETMCNINFKSEAAKLIQEAKVFVWDEAPMLDKYIYETVDRTFKDIMKQTNPLLEKIPFGGKVMVFGGDFRQILPIVKHGNRSSIVSACFNRSFLWDEIKTFKLTINKRIKAISPEDRNDQEEFAKYLLKIGEDREQKYPELGDNMIKLSDELCMPLTSALDLIKTVFENFSQNYKNEEYLINRLILATTNKIVDKINDEILNMISDEEYMLYSADSTIETKDECLYPIEFLNSLNFSGMPAHALKLKKNAVVICLRNLISYKGLCNGTRLIVRDFKKHVINCEIVTGTHKGQHIFLPRISLIPNEDEIPFQFKRRQFPIKLAFCLTINKSQGQTIQKVGIYIDEPLFHHGQLYTAMSRVTNKSCLKIMLKQTEYDNKMGFFINNVVFQEVFNKL